MTNVTSDMAQSEPTELSPRAARSREKMLGAATELLVHAGPRAVTVDAVAAASGVAKSTLYRHWDSRQELLIDVIKGSSREIQRPDLELGFESALRELMQSVAGLFADPEWIQIFPSLASLRSSIPELDAFFDADMEEKQEPLRAVLDLGIAEGVLPAALDLEDASSLLAGPLILTALLQTNQEEARTALSRLADYVVDHFIASHR